ncbi:hypothetical protein, partial [Parasutterella excrementihominis]|uniref:hypothetical protein n=1 Tax=Parasutterella excrementihominis TaxID=487175 RepID=UPI003AF1B637
LNMHFAIGFLQTQCCHYALAESLTLPLIGRVRDSHPIEVRHAGRTPRKSRAFARLFLANLLLFIY